MGNKVLCTCKPGDGTSTCPFEDQCYEEWICTRVAGHDEFIEDGSTSGH